MDYQSNSRKKEVEKMSVFSTLNSINVNEHTEKKGKLTYLSWAWAWAEVKKAYPDATYTIYENAEGWNYHTDGRTAWVKTGVTIEGIEHIEYLPVMDFKNESVPLERLTSFDVNKAIQRSLTKACARHGLGLYIYAGEDLPDGQEKPSKKSGKEFKPAPKKTDTVEQNDEEYAELPTSYRIKVQELSKLNKARADECAAWVLGQVKAGTTTGEIMEILQKAIEQEKKGGK